VMLGVPNNSFNASGMSLIVIVNLAVPQRLPAASIRAFGCSYTLNYERKSGT
jgi:hypothetical protein